MRSIRVRSVEPLTNGIRVFSIEKRGLQSWRVATFPTVQVNWREGGSWTGSRGLFRLEYWHCFTVDENLICATERDNLCHHARKGTSNTVCVCIYTYVYVHEEQKERTRKMVKIEWNTDTTYISTDQNGRKGQIQRTEEKKEGKERNIDKEQYISRI